MNRKHFLSLIILLFSTLITLSLANRPVTVTASTEANDVKMNSAQEAAASAGFANCRYGASTANGDVNKEIAAIPSLGAGWYLTFGTFAPGPPPANGADFAHMLRVQQDKTGNPDGTNPIYLPSYDVSPNLNNSFANQILANLGHLWIVGNEVDRGPNPGDAWWNRVQGDTMPDMYAQAYHDVYMFIKNVDPTAQVAISGLVEVTPGRLQYLDKVWSAYRQKYGHDMPVDVWTMHLYILSETFMNGQPNTTASVAVGTNPALGKRDGGGSAANCPLADVYCVAEHDNMGLFAEQVVSMRQWMANHGQRQKPLLITEYSILYPYVQEGRTCFQQDEYGQCFTPGRIQIFMTNTFDYLTINGKDPNLGYSLDENRLVQQSMWFSILNLPFPGDEFAAGEASNLVEDDYTTFTLLGQTFRDRIFLQDAVTKNLVVEQVKNTVAVPPEGGTATAQIAVTFRNNGNSKIVPPFAVTFYEDAALTIPIATVNISAEVLGCAGRPYIASAIWPGLELGTHEYWVKIDSDDVIIETKNNDNVGSGQVFVPEKSLRLPVISR